jgi:DNA-binding IclR family transcriptional regulator
MHITEHHTDLMTRDDRQGIQSVEVAMRVLTALEQARGPVPLSSLAKLASMPPNKAHRYLVSLIRVGLAEQEQPSGLYTLGSATRRLGIEALRRGDEVSIATTHATALRDQTQHTTNLSTWSDAGPVIIRWDYGAYPLPITVRVGSTLPLLDSSVGRVYLAHLPTTLTAPALKAQQKRGETRSMPREEVQAVLADVREAGFSLTTGGVIPGLSAIAAPIFASGPGVALVLAIAVPTHALTPAVKRSLVKDLTSTCLAITKDLGGVPENP